MRPVNLIPVENRRGETKPLRAGALSYMLLGGLALVLAGIVGVVLTGNQITDSKNDLTELKARQHAAEQRVEEFAAYGNFAQMSEKRHETVASLAQSRFDWERVLNELARVMPDDIWLDGLTATVSPGAAVGDGTSSASASVVSDPSITGPSLIISGCGDGQEAVARFVATLKDIDGVTRVGLQQSQLGDQSGASATTSTGALSTGGCQTKSFIAAFSITVAFDAVPAADAAASSSTAPAAPTSTTDDGGVASTEAEQQTATDSAATQTQSAENGASAVGLGG